VSAARWFAAHLEWGTLRSRPAARWLSRGYEAIATPLLARPVSLPPHAQTIGIGSAVLGGAGKTLVAIAYARDLALAGARVAFIAHGYSARQQAPIVCSGRESPRQVGDDTLVAARALHHLGVAVWVGQDRDVILRCAAAHADVLVIDGLLQSRPRKLDRSVLVLDAAHPFGGGACPPAGDLRGSALSFFDLCDEVVLVQDPLLGAATPATLPGSIPMPFTRTAWVEVSGLRHQQEVSPLDSVTGRKVGFASLLARPDRVLATMRARGIEPACTWHGADHRPPGRQDLHVLRKLAHQHMLDAWLVTTKCVTQFENHDLGAPCLALDVASRLDPTPLPVLDSPPCVPQDSSRSCPRPCSSSPP
jgi:tetraacyldisaccharide 4'-kinase